MVSSITPYQGGEGRLPPRRSDSFTKGPGEQKPTNVLVRSRSCLPPASPPKVPPELLKELPKFQRELIKEKKRVAAEKKDLKNKDDLEGINKLLQNIKGKNQKLTLIDEPERLKIVERELGFFGRNVGTSPKSKEAIEWVLLRVRRADEGSAASKTLAKTTLELLEKNNWALKVIKNNLELKMQFNGGKKIFDPQLTTSSKLETLSYEEFWIKMGDPQLQADFLLTYRWFVKETDFFSLSIEPEALGDSYLLSEYDLKAPSAKLFLLFNQEFDQLDVEQRKAILEMTKGWVENPRIHGKDIKDIDVQCLINLLVRKAENSGFGHLAGQISSLNETGRKRLQESSEKTSTRQTIAKDFSDYAKTISGLKSTKGEAKRFADALKSSMVSDFLQVDSSEFANKAWSKDGKEWEAPHVAAMTEKLERTNEFVASCILAADPKDMAKVIKFFVDVQKALLSPETEIKLVDFHSLKAIQGGLYKSEIARLHPLLSKKRQKELEEIHDVFAAEGNSRKIRQRMEQMAKKGIPYIPYLGTFQSDLEFLDQNGSVVDGKLNEFKLRKIGRTTADILSSQESLKPANHPVYDLTPIFSKQCGLYTNGQYDEALAHQKSRSSYRPPSSAY